MNIVKKTFRTLIFSILTLFVLYGGYTIFAADEYSFEAPGWGFYPVKNEYHDTMNDYFNDKIELFLETELSSPDQIPPPDGKCYEENVSTYCVAMEAVDIFTAYMNTLDDVTSPILSINRDVSMQYPGMGDPFATLGDTFSMAASIDNAIDAERVEAEKVMDMTIAAYNEFRLAYPMHKKYEDLISLLYKYRDMLEDVTKKTMDFPDEFIDATSKSCK